MLRPQADPYRLLLVGGGLQSALIALAALDADPQASILLLEREDALCGNHTWSFHESDVPVALAHLAPRIAEHRWPAYDVAFEDRERRVGLGYATASSTHLAQLLARRFAAAPGAHIRTGCEVVALGSRHVEVAGGERIAAELVVDARGPVREVRPGCGYQKFVGLELELETPHGLERPCVMDATVEQLDGFRFLYLLPFSPTRLLVEDTVFSTRPELDLGAWRERVLAESARRGWTPASVGREEHGVLPMPWTGEGPALQDQGPLRAGYRGLWFHPATGFSFPQAMRVAELLARHVGAPAAVFSASDYRDLVRQEQRQARFSRFLNRLLFTGVAPEHRWTVFRRFYGHSERLMTRFYAGRLTATDRTRMLVGKPPRGFSVRSALAGRAIA